MPSTNNDKYWTPAEFRVAMELPQGFTKKKAEQCLREAAKKLFDPDQCCDGQCPTPPRKIKVQPV